MSNKAHQLGILLALLVLARPAGSQQPTPSGPATLSIDKGQRSFGVSGERLNVREFGAAGSGMTDDTTAIQRAIDAAGTGDAIIFPNGAYPVTASP